MNTPITAVCSDIGRGHPAYLDSVLRALSALPGYTPDMVSRLSCNRFDSLAWRAVRLGYRLGGMGGPVTWLYNRARPAGAPPSSMLLSMLGSELKEDLAGYKGICLVDHPLLAHILAPVCKVAYLHAEIAAPAAAAVPEAWQTIVPLEQTAAQLAAHGVARDRLAVSGLLIEPEFLPRAEPAAAARLARLRSGTKLTVGLFASGAYPRPHVNRIVAATASLVQAGHRAVLFWGKGWLRAAKVRADLGRLGVPEAQARIVWASSRAAETTRTAELFGELDVMVAAAHERTNWAVGLGLPMFALLPNIGPFAAGNFTFAQEQGVCEPLATMEQAHRFGEALARCQASGRLAEMAERGRGRFPVSGAETVARQLLAAV